MDGVLTGKLEDSEVKLPSEFEHLKNSSEKLYVNFDEPCVEGAMKIIYNSLHLGRGKENMLTDRLKLYPVRIYQWPHWGLLSSGWDGSDLMAVQS